MAAENPDEDDGEVEVVRNSELERSVFLQEAAVMEFNQSIEVIQALLKADRAISLSDIFRQVPMRNEQYSSESSEKAEDFLLCTTGSTPAI